MSLLKKIGFLAVAATIGSTSVYVVNDLKKTDDKRKEEIQQLENKINSLENLVDQYKLEIESNTELIQSVKKSRLAESRTITEALQALNNIDLELKQRTDTLTKLVYGLDLLQSAKLTFWSGKVDVLSTNLKLNNEEISQLRRELGVLDVAIHDLRLNPSMIKDLAKVYSDIISPTVMITDQFRTGSGTVLYSELGEDNQYHSFVLTANHIIANANADFRIRLYDNLGQVKNIFLFDIVATKQSNDLGLVEIVSPSKLDSAKLIPKQHIKYLRILDPVYAVGCSLSNPPLPSRGELSHKRKNIEGENYLMITAPVIGGNSGGGVYTETNDKLIGVVSRVFNQPDLIPHPVPHMGVVIPPDEIYEFLEENNLQFIYDSNHSLNNYLRAKQEVPVLIAPDSVLKND